MRILVLLVMVLAAAFHLLAIEYYKKTSYRAGCLHGLQVTVDAIYNHSPFEYVALTDVDAFRKEIDLNCGGVKK